LKLMHNPMLINVRSVPLPGSYIFNSLQKRTAFIRLACHTQAFWHSRLGWSCFSTFSRRKHLLYLASLQVFRSLRPLLHTPPFLSTVAVAYRLHVQRRVGLSLAVLNPPPRTSDAHPPRQSLEEPRRGHV
jgi:hypothetical protein